MFLTQNWYPYTDLVPASRASFNYINTVNRVINETDLSCILKSAWKSLFTDCSSRWHDQKEIRIQFPDIIPPNLDIKP